MTVRRPRRGTGSLRVEGTGAMSTTLEAVRRIELAEIRQARERIAETIVRTPLVPSGAGPGLSGHSAQAGEPAADQRLQAARRGQCGGDAVRGRAQARRVDDQRRQRRARRRLRGAAGGRALHGRRDRDRAGLEDRAHEGARREARSGALRRRVEGARGAFVSRESKGRSCIRSTITTSSPVTRRWGWRSSKTRPTRPRSSPASAAAG